MFHHNAAGDSQLKISFINVQLLEKLINNAGTNDGYISLRSSVFCGNIKSALAA